jgi:ABC-type histidine transport system ATPase subunit
MLEFVVYGKRRNLIVVTEEEGKEIKVKEDKKERKVMTDEDQNLMILRFIPAGLFQQFNLTNNGESLHDSCSCRIIYYTLITKLNFGSGNSFG